jgi:hypothetical protein
MSPVGPGSMNNCAGESLQQFSSQSGRLQIKVPFIQIIKIHYRAHNSPSLVPTVRCVNPISRFFTIHVWNYSGGHDA